jgi:tape measure domain-containing protein
VARANVELIVEAAKAINPLRKVEQHSKKVDQALKKNQKSARDVEAAFQRMGRNGIRSFRDLESNAARLGKRMSGLRGTVGKAVVGFVAFKSVQTGIARLESERRIQLLGKRFGEVAVLQNAAAQAAKKFKLSQTEANQSLANAFARLRPLGVSLEDITSTFGGFRTAAILGGATAAEASASFTQLSQALGSGALRGDEFRSIAEQAPLVLQAISDETGIAAGKLKEYAAEGLLTSDIVIKALKRIESDGAESLAQALNGPAAKIKEFQNAVEDVQVAATESAIPAITDAISELGTVIRQLEPAIRFIGGLLAGVAKTAGNIVENISGGGKLAAAQLAARQATTLQTNAKFGAPGFRNTRSAEAREFEEETFKRELARRVAIVRGAVPGQLPPSAAAISSSPTGVSPITLPTKDSGGADAEEKRAAALKQQQEAFAKYMFDKEREQLLIEAQTPQQQAQLELAMQKFDLARQFPDMSEKELALARQQLQINFDSQVAADERTATEKKAAEDKKNAQDAEAQRLDALKQKQLEIAQAIQSQVVSAIESAIDGSKSLAESFSGLLKQLAMMIIKQKVIGSFASLGGGGLLGLIPGLADGGPARAGRPHIVGERGPELFVPKSSGTVVPNHAMGGGANVTVNVDASGSNVQGNQPDAKALGSAIGAAVQAELIKQKRPGGLLSA